MRASTAARFSSFNGLAKSSMMMMPSPSSVRTLAAAPLSFASSTGRSLLSTSTSANAAAKAITKKTAPGRRGSIAVASSAQGDAAAFLKSEGLSDADLRAIEAKHPDAMKAGVDTVRAKMRLGERNERGGEKGAGIRSGKEKQDGAFISV